MRFSDDEKENETKWDPIVSCILDSNEELYQKMMKFIKISQK